MSDDAIETRLARLESKVDTLAAQVELTVGILRDVVRWETAALIILSGAAAALSILTR